MNDENKPPKTRLWVRVLLGVSLALNLLVLGLIGGAMLRFGGPDGMRAPPRSVGAALFRELPREDRRALRAGAGESHDQRHVRLKADAKALGAALRATPFDAGAMEALLEGHAKTRAESHMSLQRAWLDRVIAMSNAERQAYADRLERTLNRSKGKDRRKREKHD